MVKRKSETKVVNTVFPVNSLERGIALLYKYRDPNISIALCVRKNVHVIHVGPTDIYFGERAVCAIGRKERHSDFKQSPDFRTLAVELEPLLRVWFTMLCTDLDGGPETHEWGIQIASRAFGN